MDIFEEHDIISRMLTEQQNAVRIYLDNPTEYNRGYMNGVKAVKDSILAYINLKGEEV